jgi:hypothetical protein
MAIAGSGLYLPTAEKQMIDTLGLSMESETVIYGALVLDAYTPDYTAHDFWNDVSTNEASGTGYTAGGQVVTATEITLASGVVTFDHADLSWTSSTISNAMALVDYFKRGGASSADELLLLLDFVTAASTSNGTFAVQINAAGAAQWDLVP